MPLSSGTGSLSFGGSEREKKRNRLTQRVPRIIVYLKRAANHVAGQNLWQPTFCGQIIRSEGDDLRIWQYIDTNPAKWQDDCYYTPEKGEIPYGHRSRIDRISL